MLFHCVSIGAVEKKGKKLKRKRFLNFTYDKEVAALES